MVFCVKDLWVCSRIPLPLEQSLNIYVCLLSLPRNPFFYLFTRNPDLIHWISLVSVVNLYFKRLNVFSYLSSILCIFLVLPLISVLIIPLKGFTCLYIIFNFSRLAELKSSLFHTSIFFFLICLTWKKLSWQMEFDPVQECSGWLWIGAEFKNMEDLAEIECSLKT